MPRRKIVQDILPAGKRSIRNIPIKTEENSEETRSTTTQAVFVKRLAKSKNNSGKYFLSFIIIFICVTIIGIALSFSYSKAVVTITPRVMDFDINDTLTAKKNASDGELSYEVINVSDEFTQDVKATKGPLLEIKAKGTVIIYNNYSQVAQTLVAGTRLSDSRGLVYRTVKTVSVPGKKSSPGNVEVSIVADLPGEKYNTQISDLKEDFKIVAYNETPRYEEIYARLKTDISGGFSGNKMIVDANVLKDTIQTMKDSLRAKVMIKLVNTIPNEYILYDEASTIEYEVQEPVMKENNGATLTVKAISYTAIFKRDHLISYIAGKEIKKFPGETYDIKGSEDLEFKISNMKDFSAKKGIPLIFTLKGPIRIVGTFKESELKEELSGKRLGDSNIIFEKYASIGNANTLMTPFWMRSFPRETGSITIEYKTTKTATGK